MKIGKWDSVSPGERTLARGYVAAENLHDALARAYAAEERTAILDELVAGMDTPTRRALLVTLAAQVTA